VAEHDRCIEELAHRFASAQDVIFLSRGINYPIALVDAKVLVVSISVPAGCGVR
jgi:glucosamine 6-phosphate synthetase-like amidotransferase/phosphosugar isomerase protein